MAGKCHKFFLDFVNEFSFCCHSTIKKILWNSFYLMVANSEKKPTIFDLTFDTHDNPGDIFKIYKWFWNFFIPHLLVWTGAKNTSKTQHFLMCFCCVLHQKTPRFFKWGGYRSKAIFLEPPLPKKQTKFYDGLLP